MTGLTFSIFDENHFPLEQSHVDNVRSLLGVGTSYYFMHAGGLLQLAALHQPLADGDRNHAVVSIDDVRRVEHTGLNLHHLLGVDGHREMLQIGIIVEISLVGYLHRSAVSQLRQENRLLGLLGILLRAHQRSIDDLPFFNEA